MSTPAFLQYMLALVAPLRFAAENEEYLHNVAAAIGWDIDEVAGFDADAAAADVAQIANGIEALANHISNPPDSVVEFLDALDDAERTFTAVRDLATVFGGAGASNLDDFGKALLEALVIANWYQRSPVTLSVAEILALVRVPDDGPLIPAIRDGERLIRVEHRRGEQRFGEIGTLLRDPVEFLGEEYFAGDALATMAGAHAAADKLFPRLARLAILLGFEASYGLRPDVPVTGGATVIERIAHMLTLFVAPHDREMYGLTLALSSDDRGRRGLLISPFGSIQFQNQIDDWKIQLTAGGSLDGLLLGPSDIEVSGDGSLVLGLAIERNAEIEEAPSTLGGEKSGFTYAKLRIEGELELGQNTREASIDLVLEQAHLAVAGSEGDGFLSTVLPEDGLSADFDFAFGWSNTSGFHFNGSGALQAAYPIHKSIGPVNIDSFKLETGTDDSEIRAQISFTAGLKLGPLAVKIDGIGLKALVDFPDDGGNLGVGGSRSWLQAAEWRRSVSGWRWFQRRRLSGVRARGRTLLRDAGAGVSGPVHAQGVWPAEHAFAKRAEWLLTAHCYQRRVHADTTGPGLQAQRRGWFAGSEPHHQHRAAAHRPA